MDTLETAVADLHIAPRNDNQVPSVNQQPEIQITGGCFENLSPEIWLIVNDHLDSLSDTFRLSRVNKFLWSLLIPARARPEAKRHAVVPTPHEFYRPSMLCLEIKRNPSCLDDIRKIIAVYKEINPALIETNRTPCHRPPLHVAVVLNRLDIVELILDAGVSINIRWSLGLGNQCHTKAHEECFSQRRRRCKNALTLAKEYGHREMQNYLIQRGIEELSWDKPGLRIKLPRPSVMCHGCALSFDGEECGLFNCPIISKLLAAGQ
ncbi:hypothetical protein SAMD00023353_2400940 [Rosellinia necatrix]|uniref:Uncharacterized protein n=1 Tax=Rosellinia necatrix TaxID=77044 RepID=A0A1W2TFT7_ROSNE|nr:hypothetical protein SAMD00023353_2400940 [Rosellinia necatrix]